MPFVRLREALRDARLAGAAVLGNFVILPFVAWGPATVAPNDSVA